MKKKDIYKVPVFNLTRHAILEAKNISSMAIIS